MSIDMKLARSKAREANMALVTFKYDARTMIEAPKNMGGTVEFAGPVEPGRALAAYKVLTGSPLTEDDVPFMPRYHGPDGGGPPRRQKKPGRRPDL